MAEFWDAYDRDFHRMDGVTLTRGKPLPPNVYHLVCDTAVRHADGTYLLMRRDLRKHRGGLWELTAGGSALRGETPAACAARELREETGISAETLTEIGRAVQPERHSLYVEFLCAADCPKDAVTLQPGETMDFRWVRREELAALEEELASARILRFLPGEEVRK
jgi:8-oxo-dGTP diphosphatase